MKPLRAWSLIRTQPHYRHEAFLEGLSAEGFVVCAGMPEAPRPGEVLVIWNRYGELERVADKFEASGGIVLVAENGYLGMDRKNRQLYALAIHAHNGRGRWFPGGPERFASLGIALQPERRDGEYVLVAPNRSFGMRGGVMAPDWAENVAAQLRREGHAVRVRPHPGNLLSKRPLTEDLAGAARVVIWSSSVGVAALVAGIPVECHAPWWICKGKPRQQALDDLAWAQWHVEEIARGDPFRHLLSHAGQVESAAAV